MSFGDIIDPVAEPGISIFSVHLNENLIHVY